MIMTDHSVDRFPVRIDQLLVAHSVGENEVNVKDETNENDGEQCDHQMEVN